MKKKSPYKNYYHVLLVINQIGLPLALDENLQSV